MEKRNKFGELVDEDGNKVEESKEKPLFKTKDISHHNHYHLSTPVIHSGEDEIMGFDATQKMAHGHKVEICLWCKYGQEAGQKKADKIKDSSSQTQMCPRCKKSINAKDFEMEE